MGYRAEVHSQWPEVRRWRRGETVSGNDSFSPRAMETVSDPVPPDV
jgi:hypothetical protein